MRFALLVLVVVLISFGLTDGFARREILTPQQKEVLAKIQRVQIEVVALTEHGAADAAPLHDVVGRRLQEIEYTIVPSPSEPHDALLRVKCEQNKVWEGTMASGGDADLPDSPSRVWKGPACQFRYLVQGKQSDWRKEVRTEFVDARQAAESAKAGDPAAYAMAKLKERLEDYDFPIRLAAEWGHEDRLLKTFDASGTSKPRKLLIIALLGEMFSAKAAPRLTTALKDPDVDIAKASAVALGNIGQRESIPALIELLKSHNRELRIAAAKGLGQVGAFHGDNSIIPPLLDALNTDDLELKTEVVWALGKLPDRRAYEPLRQLQASLLNVRTSDRSSQEAKLWDAVSYSLKQLDAFDQLN